MIWLYAIADGLRGLPPVEGIDGAQLTVWDCAGLDVVTSMHEDATIEPDEKTVLAHARVVEALVPLTFALLPARFGVAYEDFAGLEAALRKRGPELQHSLERSPGTARFYAGLVLWQPGELAEELKRGLWLKLEVPLDTVFRQDAEGLWDELLAIAQAVRT